MNGIAPNDLGLVLRHEAALRRLAAALCHDAADAEDAVQHTLAQATVGRRGAGSPTFAFLSTVLRNHVRNLAKLATRRRRRDGIAAAKTTADAPAADELVARDELRRRVSGAVLALLEPYRTTVWLRWFEGLDVDAVATRMEVPRNTVRTRLQRAHARLREQLDRDYGDRTWIAVAVPWGARPPRTAAGRGTAKHVLTLAAAVTAVVTVLALQHAAPSTHTPGAVVPDERVATSSPPPGDLPAVRMPVAASTVRFVDAHGTPLAEAPVWFWPRGDRPRWTQRARPGRPLDGIDDQRDTLPPATAVLATGKDGAVVPPADVEAAAAVSVRFAPALWFTTALPEDRVVVLPATAVATATAADAPAGTGWSATFAALTGELDWGDARLDVATASGPGVVWVGVQTVSGPGTQPLAATVLAGMRTKLDRVTGHGFRILDDAPAANAPCEFRCRWSAPVPRLEVELVDAQGTRVPQRAFAVDLGIGRPQWLEGGATVFDSRAADAYGRLLVRLADGRSFERAVDLTAAGGGDPEAARIRIPFVLEDAAAPLRLAHDPPLGTASRVWLELQPSQPWLDVGRHADHNFGFGRWEFGDAPDGTWVAGIPADWRRIVVTTMRGRMVRFQPDGIADVAPAAPPTAIDVERCFAVAAAPPHATATLWYEVPYSVPRSFSAGGERDAKWKVVLEHTRNPEAREVVRVPVWHDIELPTATAWRITVCDAERNLLREFRSLP